MEAEKCAAAAGITAAVTAGGPTPKRARRKRCALVYALPSLDLLLGLVGALTTTTIAALPCVIHLKLLLRPDTLARTREVEVGAEAGEEGPGLPNLGELAPPMARTLVVVDAAIVLLCAAVAVAGVDQALRRLAVSV